MKKAAPQPTPPAKTPAKDAKDQRLTDTYAAEARKDELRKGDELSELGAVGRKPSGA